MIQRCERENRRNSPCVCFLLLLKFFSQTSRQTTEIEMNRLKMIAIFKKKINIPYTHMRAQKSDQPKCGNKSKWNERACKSFAFMNAPIGATRLNLAFWGHDLHQIVCIFHIIKWSHWATFGDGHNTFRANVYWSWMLSNWMFHVLLLFLLSSNGMHAKGREILMRHKAV